MPSCTCGRRFINTQALHQHQQTKKHGFCKDCGRFFRTDAALEHHRSSVHNFPCPACSRLFTKAESLEAHQRSTGHCYCRPCDRFFSADAALQQHRSSVHDVPCPACSKTFTNAGSLQTHQRSTGHCYCRPCDRFFIHSEALADHLRSTTHATHFHCCDCDRDFLSEHALEQHLADKKHHHPPSSSDYECEECGREFKDKKALSQHRSSVVHNPLSNIRCFGSGRCKKRFNCPSAMVQHLESGGCCSDMSREKLDAIIHSRDTDCLITCDGDTLAEDMGIMTRNYGPSPSESIAMYTPDSSISAGLLTPCTDQSSSFGQLTPQMGSSRHGLLGLSISTAGMKCPLCPPHRKRFRSLQALQDHISSPAHAQKVYHCPLALFSSTAGAPNRIKYFSTLSGLTQHIESGAFKGGKATFRQAIRLVEEKLQQLGFEQSRLLN